MMKQQHTLPILLLSDFTVNLSPATGASPACGLSDFARPQNSACPYKGGGSRQGAAGGSRLDGAGFEQLRNQAAVGLQRLRQRPAAGDGVQTDGGGQGGGGGALLHGGAHVGGGFQQVARRGGEVAHALDPLAELPRGRDWKEWDKPGWIRAKVAAGKIGTSCIQRCHAKERVLHSCDE